MGHPIFSQGLLILLLPPLALVILIYLVNKLVGMSSKALGRLYLFSWVCDLLVVFVTLIAYALINSGLVNFSPTWEQLSCINQITWSNVWSWYFELFLKLLWTHQWYIIVIIAFSLLFITDWIGWKRMKKTS